MHFVAMAPAGPALKLRRSPDSLAAKGVQKSEDRGKRECKE